MLQVCKKGINDRGCICEGGREGGREGVTRLSCHPLDLPGSILKGSLVPHFPYDIFHDCVFAPGLAAVELFKSSGTKEAAVVEACRCGVGHVGMAEVGGQVEIKSWQYHDDSLGIFNTGESEAQSEAQSALKDIVYVISVPSCNQP